MKFRRVLPAVAAFWSMIRCAVLYYILLAMRPLEISPVDRFLYLWMISPAMVSAAAFFFVYLRPKDYPSALVVGRFSLGLDAIVAAISLIGMSFSNLSSAGIFFQNSLEVFIGICAVASIVVELSLLFLMREKQVPGDEEYPPIIDIPSSLEPVAKSRPADNGIEEP